MKEYQDAIENDEIEDFMFGRGKYFVRDRDWGGHDETYTYSSMIEYGLENGEEVLYHQADSDISNTLNKRDLTVDEFTNLFGFIWFYLVYRYDRNILNKDWEISKNLRFSINKRIEEFRLKGEDISNIERAIRNMKERFGYVI